MIQLNLKRSLFSFWIGINFVFLELGIQAFVPSLPTSSLLIGSCVLFSSRFPQFTEKRQSISVVINRNDGTGKIILPGETCTISADRSFPQLLKNCITKDDGLIAVGITSDSNYESEDLLEIASFCKIQNYDLKNLRITVKCIGRIKLEEFKQFEPYWKCYFSVFEEDQSQLKKCKLVAQNIDIFIRKLSQKEKNGRIKGAKDNISERFKVAYKQAYFEDLTTKHQSQEIRSLTATSWAAFTSLREYSFPMNLYNYRLRAIDYDTLFDRLKLAQYMLRELELREQGEKLVDEEDFDDCFHLSSDTFQ